MHRRRGVWPRDPCIATCDAGSRGVDACRHEAHCEDRLSCREASCTSLGRLLSRQLSSRALPLYPAFKGLFTLPLKASLPCL